MMQGRRFGWLLVVWILAIGLSAQVFAAETVINFSSLDSGQTYSLHGNLYLPENATTPSPAVIVIHGTMGIDSRGAFYREAILNAGIAFFEVDFKTGVYTGAKNRPKNDNFVPMAFAALKELQKLPAIDPNRIAIMGFSLGGGVTVRTAIEAYRETWMGNGKGFIAHIAFYPVCRFIGRKMAELDSGMTGAPMIIFYGTKDSYGEGTAVPEFKTLLEQKYNFKVETVEYPGAHHGFNRNQPAMSYEDPAAIDGKGDMAWDADAANDSLTKVKDFLYKNLAVH
jgi:dienelactone hydrolase